VWVAGGVPGPARLGLTARSRSSVERNRIRRRLRAAWREVEPGPSSDVVVAADRASLEVDFPELVNHLRRALAEAGRHR